MKLKYFICMVMAALMMIPSAAFAAGKLSYEENFFIAGEYSTYGYVFAKVENVGDKPIMVKDGLLEIFDAEGNPITSNDYLQRHAEYLQPGEYTYVKIHEKVDGDKVALVDDYSFTLAGKSDNDYISKRLPCTSYYAVEEDTFLTKHYIYVTVTNDTDSPIYNVGVVAAMFDADGNIIAMPNDQLYSVAIEPCSSVTFRLSVDSNFISYFADNNIVPTTVDAIAYSNIDNPLAE